MRVPSGDFLVGESHPADLSWASEGYGPQAAGIQGGLDLPISQEMHSFLPRGLRIRVGAPPFTCLPTSLGVLADQMSAPISNCQT